MIQECSRHTWAKQNKYTDTAGVFKAPVFISGKKEELITGHSNIAVSFFIWYIRTTGGHNIFVPFF